MQPEKSKPTSDNMPLSEQAAKELLSKNKPLLRPKFDERLVSVGSGATTRGAPSRVRLKTNNKDE
jgi:hypothetical protein